MTPHNQRMLLGALAAAGVYLGAYDHRIAEWLAGWEPSTVAVIAGWVQRASEGGQADAASAVDELVGRTRDGPGHETGDKAPMPQGTASTQPGHHHAPKPLA